MTNWSNIAIASFVVILLLLSGSNFSLGKSDTAYCSNERGNSLIKQMDKINYTQMCLDFIRENYPGKNITYIDSGNIMDAEVRLNYTILTADIFPGSVQGLRDSVEVSIRHDTLKIEFGLSQINNDARAYFNSLPAPYKKCSRDTRLMLLIKFGHLPTIEETKTMNYRVDATIETASGNRALLLSKLRGMGYSNQNAYNYWVQNTEYTDCDVNITLHDILAIAENPWVNVCTFYELMPFTPHSDTGNTITVVLGIGVGFGLLAGSTIISYRKKKKR